MLRFPIQWVIPNIFDNFGGSDQVISKLLLNEEWEIVFLRNSNGKGNHAFDISRKSTSEQMLVTGIFFIQENKETLSAQDFFTLMEPESSMENLSVITLPAYKSEHNNPLFGNSYSQSIRKLGGVLYIAPVSDLSGNDECKKCQSLMELTNNFGLLLDPQTSYFTDVNLKCDDVIIPAHKNILSARSTVFSTMFSIGMKENHGNQVDIVDMESCVVREMLNYMYTGKTSDLTVPLASGLLFAADKYQLKNLKRMCCDYLKSNMSIQNAMGILILGDLHDENLKSFAEDFICNKCPDFSVFENTEEWKTMRKEKPHLTVDILTSLMKLKNKKSEVNGETKENRDGRRKFPFFKNLYKSGVFNRFV